MTDYAEHLCPMPAPKKQTPTMERDYFNDVEMRDLRQRALRAAYSDALLIVVASSSLGDAEARIYNRRLEVCK